MSRRRRPHRPLTPEQKAKLRAFRKREKTRETRRDKIIVGNEAFWKAYRALCLKHNRCIGKVYGPADAVICPYRNKEKLRRALRQSTIIYNGFSGRSKTWKEFYYDYIDVKK